MTRKFVKRSIFFSSCVNQYEYYHTIISTLMDKCFPSKTVTRHTSDRPWVTDGFRSLIRKRQRAHMSGDITQERRLRNYVNRADSNSIFFQSKIAAINESGSRDWWKQIKLIMGLHRNTQPDMHSLANNIAEGDYEKLTNIMNYFFVSVSSHLPPIRNDDPVFARMDELPDQYIISVETTIDALTRVKVNKATGPDDIPAWVIRNNADVLAAPLTAIFNSSLREGILPPQWKSAYVVPVPKVHPPVSIEKDFRPISLTPITAKVFESIVVKRVDDSLLSEIDDKQFGGITGTSTTDALVEMANMWYEATDKLDVFVRVILLDFSKAFDLINHRILIEKLHSFGIPSHILRWVASFLMDRTQKVKVQNYLSSSGTPSGGVPQGTCWVPNVSWHISTIYTLHAHYLSTWMTVPFVKYVTEKVRLSFKNQLILLLDGLNKTI